MDLPNWAQNSWILALLLTSGTGVILSLFSKFIPRKKLIDMTVPKSKAFGTWLSAQLIIRMGKKAADRVEEGIFVTIFDVLSENCKAVKEAMLKDNAKKKPKTDSK